ncbi:MAG: hypothetical protein E7373_03515 [Clostridiales bacterium]|nr:hypothetical protein [Clostridiales bacterium]
MNNASIWIKNLFEKIKNNKLFQYLIIGILAVTLIFLACTKSKSNESQNYNQVDEVSAYLENLEEKLSKTLSSVSGAGKVSVVITVESGMQTVLASKTVTTSDENGTKIEESPIIVNGKTVVIKELYPKITGVLIVAQGANNISVLSKLQQATVSLLDIELNQIEILTMK